MHEFRVWAPRPGEVEVVVGGQRLPMRPAGRRLVGVPRGGGGAGHRLFVQSRRRPAPAGPSLGLPAPRHRRPVPGRRPLPRSPGPMSGWRGLPLAGSVLYECHVGTFSPEGTFDGVIGRLDHLVELGVDAIELMPVAEFSGPRGLGLRRGRPVRPAPRLRRAGRSQAAGRRGARPRPGRGAGRRLQPSGPGRELPAGVRPVLFGPAPDQLGRRHQLRWPGQRRGPAVRHRQRPGLAARLPLRRAAAGRRRMPSATTRPPTSWRRSPSRWARWPRTSAARCS